MKRARSQGYVSDDGVGLNTSRMNSARVMRRALKSKNFDSVISA